MFASFTVLSVCVTAVFAATGNSDALVPSDISKTCSDFLNQLDGDSTMAACTSSLISSTSAYGPGGNATGTQSGISDTLTTFCGASTSNTCPDSLIRSTLANFQTACSDELASNPNDAVVRMYDVLYALTPLRKAICTKGDDGSWCISKSSANLNGGTAPSGAAKVDLVVQNEDLSKYLFVQAPTVKRDESNAMYPNTTTFCNNNLIFDFLSASLPHDTLCTTCTRNILNSYVSFEKSQPYAPGLGQSQLLCGQADLMTGVKTTCGDNFLDDSANGVQAAGGISNNGPVGGTSAAVPSSVANLKTVIGAFAGAVTFTLFAMN